MVKPVNHDTTSALATGWFGAAKGALGGVAAVGAAGGALSALVAGAVAAIISTPLVLPVAGIAFVVGGVATATALFTPSLIGGGLLGLMGGGSKVSAEKAAYLDRVNRRSGLEEARMQQMQMEAMQQGYQMGASDGQQAIIAQLQQAHANLVKSNAGIGSAPGANAAKVDASRAAGMSSPAVA